MKKFKFRLQKVMEFKEEIERQRMLDLGKAKKRVSAEDRKLEQLWQKDSECRKQIEDKEKEYIINPVEMNLYYRYLKKLGTDMESQKERIQAAKSKMEENRQILIAATKERKILEKLKEKRCFAYITGIARKEQVILDDLANTAFIRRRLNQ